MSESFFPEDDFNFQLTQSAKPQNEQSSPQAAPEI